VSVRDRDVLLKERTGYFSQERLSKSLDVFGDRVGFQADGTWKVVRTTPALLLEDMKKFKDLIDRTGQIVSGSL
jgi:hypothetical protein